MGSKRKSLPVFGTPKYLVTRFDDIFRATISRKSKVAKEFKALVDSLSTSKDNMHVYRVVATEGIGFDGKSKGFVAQVCLGLNGSGSQADYCDAIKRLVSNKKMKAFVFDAWIDAVDDLMDVLVRIG